MQSENGASLKNDSPVNSCKKKATSYEDHSEATEVLSNKLLNVIIFFRQIVEEVKELLYVVELITLNYVGKAPLKMMSKLFLMLINN